MKLQGASWADIQAKAKAGNIEGIAVNAETLAMTAQQIPGLFPEGSGTEKSKAKPDVWQKTPRHLFGIKHDSSNQRTAYG